MVDSPREKLIQRWERISTLPLAGLAIAYLTLYALEVLADFAPVIIADFIAVNDVIWALFAVDFIVRFSMHDNKIKFLRSNVIEAISLLLPFFRALRMFRVMIAIGFLARVGKSLQSRIYFYLGVLLPLTIFICSLGVYEAEHKAVGANINSFGDAVWWATVTITTIGYGDYFPVTIEGRIIAVLLMISGLVLVSLVTISIANWFLQRLEYDLELRKSKSEKNK